MLYLCQNFDVRWRPPARTVALPEPVHGFLQLRHDVRLKHEYETSDSALQGFSDVPDDFPRQPCVVVIDKRRKIDQPHESQQHGKLFSDQQSNAEHYLVPRYVGNRF